jgi:hypothetical protein
MVTKRSSFPCGRFSGPAVLPRVEQRTRLGACVTSALAPGREREQTAERAGKGVGT